MVSYRSLTASIIARAESFTDIKAGIARLDEILQGPSYQAAAEDPESTTPADETQIINWPPKARSVLVLGLYHPADNPRLDWWERGDAWGNRRLIEISEALKPWLRKEYKLDALPLPYHVEKGGLFLKDAGVLSGLGIIGRSNLFLHPKWGSRIRLRSVLIEGNLNPTKVLDGFSPCDACEGFCHKACPVKAFPEGTYRRSICRKQMDADIKNKVSDGELDDNGKRHLVIKYCRECELACPIGS
ncbi:MAG: hypothetical protein JSW04_01210 [Desulfobacterales bacterium]|nr:MAG: hypothetical protein JSW04_01210 [Desulfobacterales bacterium]